MKRGDSALGILYRHEMRMVLRDRRTMIVSVLLPLAVMPLMFVMMNRVQKAREERLEVKTYSYAIGGSQADFARELLQAALDPALFSPSSEERPLNLDEIESDDPAKALDKVGK